MGAGGAASEGVSSAERPAPPTSGDAADEEGGYGIRGDNRAPGGSPGVAYRFAGGPRDSIRDGETGLLADDYPGLRDAVATLLTDAGMAARLAEGARRRAAEFSVERTAERTLAVYERVLARPAGPE